MDQVLTDGGFGEDVSGDPFDIIIGVAALEETDEATVGTDLAGNVDHVALGIVGHASGVCHAAKMGLQHHVVVVVIFLGCDLPNGKGKETGEL
mmetsp:Transcript_99858/g.149593  ORF Transcript_99858/g.149593 Transcript_99858/m.149593 type:complete len:93 (-) Transcript_99858:304-582(-)